MFKSSKITKMYLRKSFEEKVSEPILYNVALDNSILQSKAGSFTRCDSFKKLHISSTDRTVFASNLLSRLPSNL